MYPKIKMALLPLFCLIALSGCGTINKGFVPSFIMPKDAATCDEFPAPPIAPLDCVDHNGAPALCQSEVAVWIETEVKPAYQQCQSSNEYLKSQIR